MDGTLATKATANHAPTKATANHACSMGLTRWGARLGTFRLQRLERGERSRRGRQSPAKICILRLMRTGSATPSYRTSGETSTRSPGSILLKGRPSLRRPMGRFCPLPLSLVTATRMHDGAVASRMHDGTGTVPRDTRGRDPDTRTSRTTRTSR